MLYEICSSRQCWVAMLGLLFHFVCSVTRLHRYISCKSSHWRALPSPRLSALLPLPSPILFPSALRFSSLCYVCCSFVYYYVFIRQAINYSGSVQTELTRGKRALRPTSPVYTIITLISAHDVTKKPATVHIIWKSKLIALHCIYILHTCSSISRLSPKVTDRSFQYAPHLWNQFPSSLREPVSPLYAYLNPSFCPRMSSQGSGELSAIIDWHSTGNEAFYLRDIWELLIPYINYKYAYNNLRI